MLVVFLDSILNSFICVLAASVAFFALMTLLKIEVENVTTIIEGIRYQNNPDEIEKLLILE